MPEAAILQLLSTYRLRVGEITRLQLDDIDWSAETLHIRHSKTGAQSLLPLTEPVGEAPIDYLRHGHSKTDAREIFVRSRAPYRPLSRIYSEVLRRMEAAGVRPSGKRGPHMTPSIISLYLMSRSTKIRPRTRSKTSFRLDSLSSVTRFVSPPSRLRNLRRDDCCSVSASAAE